VRVYNKHGSVPDAFAGELVNVRVVKSEAQKCGRCWRYLESVGKHKRHPELCDRCASVVEKYYNS
jgi:isoleucyl-tRNA synthetase